MINAEARLYNYYTLGADNGYGVPQISTDPKGSIKMAIFPTNTTIQANINYKEAEYIGLTQAKVDDTYIIEFKEERLKVLYTNPIGRLTQVFLKKI